MFNLFDAVVVAFSLVELVFELVPNLKGVQGLTVLRTFRLMRVFKLVRTWVALRNLLNTILLSLYVEKRVEGQEESESERKKERPERCWREESVCARAFVGTREEHVCLYVHLSNNFVCNPPFSDSPLCRMDVANASVILCLILMVFALLGTELFGGTPTKDQCDKESMKIYTDAAPPQCLYNRVSCVLVREFFSQFYYQFYYQWYSNTLVHVSSLQR